MFVIDEALQQFVESGVAIHVGTIDEDGRPRSSFAWGPRVHADRRRVSVYLDAPRSAPVLRGLAVHPQVALTATDPVSVRSVQFKGRLAGQGEPNEAERTWVERHRNAFLASTALVGDPPQVIRNFWMADTVRIDVEVDRAFIQTPGPTAGMPL